MKQSVKTHFSISTLDKQLLKDGAFKRMQTSFAIEGVHFSDKQISNLKTQILRTERVFHNNK